MQENYVIEWLRKFFKKPEYVPKLVDNDKRQEGY